MRSNTRRRWAAALLGTALAALPAGAAPTDSEVSQAAREPAAKLAKTLVEPSLAALVDEVLQRNPELAAAVARARAAAQRAPQVAALPDPMLAVTAFLAPPETRVGPQRLMVGATQRLPWFGKLGLKERAAVLQAAAVEADVEAMRLRLVTETRRLWFELAFLERHRQITEEYRRHLLQHEEIARARYATGVGSAQGVVKIQAEITRLDNQLLDIRNRRAGLMSRLNGLRDRPAAALPTAPRLPLSSPLEPDRSELERVAFELRPELAATAAGVARAEVLEELAKKEYKPDFTLGLTYTVVEPREDLPGRLQPPPGNGDDVFGLVGGVALPVRRRKLAAGLEEAQQLRFGAQQAERAVRAAIAADLDELVDRIPLGWRQLKLLEDVLVLQAEEALDSARAGYVAGTLNALDLLDAEHVLFGAHTAVARASADYAIFIARLEGVIGRPLTDRSRPEEPES